MVGAPYTVESPSELIEHARELAALIAAAVPHPPELARTLPEVIGIDQHGPSIELARRHGSGSVEYVQDDFLRHEFEPGSFDLVASVAAVHHMPAATALRRMRDLTRPGGTLAVIGLARARIPTDLPHRLAAALAHRLYRLTRPYWEHRAPTVWPPPGKLPGHAAHRG